MSLKYTELDQVKNQYVSINGVNTSLYKLIENDIGMIETLQTKPDVWQCRWYNDSTAPKYSRGDVIWVNTEDIDEFVTNRFEEIQRYVVNSEYRNQYFKISDDISETQQMFKNICQGENGYRRLFYLGDISAQAQVKVSLVDNNTDLPTVLSSWKDSLRLSSQSMYEEAINDSLQDYLDGYFQSHIDNFHLSSMTLTELTTTYLLNDFSNVSKTQSLNTHTPQLREKQTTGFDSIELFVRKKTTDGFVWFRVWKSGHLEHGGTVSCSGPTVSVDLAWTYGNDGNTAPIYDYRIVYDGFYELQNEPYIGGETIGVNSKNIGDQQTYSIAVTPICENGKEMSKETAEILNIGNEGFQISNEGEQYDKFSYYTSGFITSATMRKYGL